MPAHAWYSDGTRSKGFGSASDDTDTSETPTESDDSSEDADDE